MFRFILRSQFKSTGKNFEFSPLDSIFYYNNITVGDNVHIGSKAVLIASESEINIGYNENLAPSVTIRGGTHNIEVIGRFMSDVRNKEKKHDLGVIVEDDVWIASNVIVLHGTIIQQG